MGPLHLLTWCLLCLVHNERLAAHPRHSHMTETVPKNTERLDHGVPKNILVDNRLEQVLYQHEHRREPHHQHGKNNNHNQASKQPSSRQTANSQDKTFTQHLPATHDGPSGGQEGPSGDSLEISGMIDTTGVTVWIQGRQVSVVKGVRYLSKNCV